VAVNRRQRRPTATCRPVKTWLPWRPRRRCLRSLAASDYWWTNRLCRGSLTNLYVRRTFVGTLSTTVAGCNSKTALLKLQRLPLFREIRKPSYRNPNFVQYTVDDGCPRNFLALIRSSSICNARYNSRSVRRPCPRRHVSLSNLSYNCRTADRLLSTAVEWLEATSLCCCCCCWCLASCCSRFSRH